MASDDVGDIMSMLISINLGWSTATFPSACTTDLIKI